MEKVFVVMSYWCYESTYGDTSKVECVVIGDTKRAKEIAEEIKIKLSGECCFCYVDTEETVIIK